MSPPLRFYSNPWDSSALNVGGALDSSLFPDIGKSAALEYMTNNPTAGTGGVANARPDFLSWDGFLGSKNADGSSWNGWGGQALGLLQGVGSAYMGLQQYGLAKDQLQFSKDAFNKNYAAQTKMTNASLMDRQRARVAANSGAYQSVGDYMAQNRIA